MAASSPWSLSPIPPDSLPFSLQQFSWDVPPSAFPASLCAFFHALRAGAPWAFALETFSQLPLGFFSSDGRIFAVPALRGCSLPPSHSVCLSHPEGDDSLTLLFRDSSLVAIVSSHPLRSRPLPSPSAGLVQSPRGYSFPSRFLPAFIRLKKQPARDVMSVFRAAPEWHRRLGPLDAVTRSVVEGRLIMPKPRFPLRPSRRSNHPSWERNEAAKLALGPKFATWTWQGIVEIVPRNCPLPLFIEPLGAVDKATAPFWRLILDARLSNEYQDSWGVWYFSVWQLAALLDHCDLMFVEDLEDAYHLSIFSGCTGRPMWSLTFAIDEHGQVVARWRLVMGCDPFTCLGFCDKAMSGFCIDGFVGRFAAAHFGQRNAGSPLNALMRCIQRFLARRGPPPAPRPHSRRQPPAPPAPGPCSDPPLRPVVTRVTAHPPPPPPSDGPRGDEPPSPLVSRASVSSLPHPSDDQLFASRRGLQPQALHTAVWVDDTVFVTKTRPHPPCSGLTGGCPVCAQTARSAARSQSAWHRLADSLGLGLSDEKRQLPSQRITYTGIVVDSFHHTLSIPPEKKLRLATCLESFLASSTTTAHDLASLRGRVQHYSCCLPYVLPFVALFSSILGTESQPDGDRPIDVPPVAHEAAAFIRGVLEDFALTGRRLWPLVASSLHAAFLAGETGSARIAVITWDASLHGWGLLLRWWDNREGKVVVGSLPDSDDMQHQVRREAHAGTLALEAAARELDLSGAVVIMRNDAVGALAALRKGSFSSTFLQQCAMRTCRLERQIGCETLYLHAPGRVLVDEGVDRSSRDIALEVSGPASGPRIRDAVSRLARDLGWLLTVDAFATESNTLLPRFFARFAEPRAEAEDAFTVPDWGCSVCPSCGHTHRETLFAYPPPALLPRFVAKAREDGSRALVVTPLAVTAPYWNKLLRFSVLPNADGFFRIRSRPLPSGNNDADMDLALFAVDFSRAQTRRRLPSAPGCGQESLFRGRPLRGSAADQAERARIHAHLDAVGMALRPRP